MQRDLVRGARLREQQQAAERLHLVADAVAGDEQARLGAPDGLDRRPLDEGVVHEQRAVAGQEQVAHEGLDDVGRVPQRAGPRRDAQAAGVGGERLRALDAGLDLLVEGAGQVVAIAAEAVVAQAGRGRGRPRAGRAGRDRLAARVQRLARFDDPGIERRRIRRRRRRRRTAWRRRRPPRRRRRTGRAGRRPSRGRRPAPAGRGRRGRGSGSTAARPARRWCRRRSGRSAAAARRRDGAGHRAPAGSTGRPRRPPAASASAGAACAGRPAPRPGRRPGRCVAMRSQPASTSTRATAANRRSRSGAGRPVRCSRSARW